MDTYKFFDYKFINKTNEHFHPNIKEAVYDSLKRWEEIIIINPYLDKIKVNIYLEKLSPGILGYAIPEQIIGNVFGYTFTTQAKVSLNLLEIKRNKYDKNLIYNIVLHEFGHALGIGIFWNLKNSPIKTFIEDNNAKKNYYIGKNALKYYKKYFLNDKFIGIPIEDDGHDGTKDGHPEEGYLITDGIEVSRDNRYVNGIYHPGLQNEIMTGWLSKPSPISMITLGFLEDIGYGVDYSKVDDYNPFNLDIKFEKYNQKLWQLPDNNTYDSKQFKQLMKIPNIYTIKDVKILIIDTGFDKNVLFEKGIIVNDNNYKNFTKYSSGNDTIHGTNVFLTINEYAPGATYLFAESEWDGSESLKEVDNMINAIKWGKDNNVDIINISVFYTFRDKIMLEKKIELNNLVKEMPNTLFFCISNNIYFNQILLPNDIKDIIKVGNTFGIKHYINNNKPDIVVPNISFKGIIDDNDWNNNYNNGKLTAVMSGIFAYCISERKYLGNKYIKEHIYKSSSINYTVNNLYGHGLFLVDVFLKLTNDTNYVKDKIYLNKGWNLVSFSLKEINFNEIKNNKSILIIKNNKKSYNKSVPDNFNTLTDFDIGSGYWINSNDKSEINIEGIKIDEYIFKLSKGWNLISCPFCDSIELNNFIIPEIEEIKGNNQIYNSKLPFFNNLKYLKPYQGYYLKSNREVNWIIKIT